MNSTLRNLVIVAALAVASLFAATALGHDRPIATPMPFDGGLAGVQLAASGTYVLQCKIPTCYRMNSDGGAPQCTITTQSDYVLPLVGSLYERQLDSAGGGLLLVHAADAGDPNCNLFQRTGPRPQ